jgi:phosphoesterase RecJ-like protein
MKSPEDLLSRLRQSGRVLITSHANPDGDAIGAQLGLARLLRRMGKGVTVWDRDPVPAIYRALPASERIHVGMEPPRGFPDDFDTLVVLECPSLDRTGLEMELERSMPILNIDHHLGNQHYGAVNWVDVSAPAVGEMVLRLASDLKLEIDADTAACLYLALVSDTGGFRHANSTPRAFEAASLLVSRGASPERVAQWLYESRPPGMLRLLGEMLGTLELSSEGRVATALLTPEMYARAGASPSDSEGMVDYPRSIQGVAAVALLRVLDGERVKISLRSRGDGVDVERIARRHGGGGHRAAAGFEAAGDLAALRRAIADELARELTPAETPAETA